MADPAQKRVWGPQACPRVGRWLPRHVAADRRPVALRQPSEHKGGHAVRPQVGDPDQMVVRIGDV